MSFNRCLAEIVHNFVLGLPDDPAPHTIYFVRVSSGIQMYVTDGEGVPYLIGGTGGGGTINLTSPNGTITIVGQGAIDVSPDILDTIISLHNSFPDLDGGTWHLEENEWQYLTDLVANNTIQQLTDAVNLLATPPTYVQPTSSITNVTGTYEVGSTQNINISQTFVQNNAGAKISETITKNGSTVSNTSSFSEVLTVIFGGVAYGGTVTYGQGACLQNNIGIVDCANRVEAGTVTSPNRVVTGIYPVYYLKSSSPITAASMQSAINSGTATKLVIPSTGSFQVPYAPSSQYYAVAYPASSTTKTVWYVNALDNGAIPGGVFGSQSTLPVSSSQSFWTAQNYKIHVTPLLNNPSASTIELRNS